MTASRRDFLKLSVLSGCALTVGFRLDAAENTPFVPNAFIRIDPDGLVTLTASKAEMGQGVRTSLAMILAEELDADWERVKVVTGQPGKGVGSIGTGGSWSVRALWTPLRTAGAAAREMLVAAAAAKLGVEAAELRTEKGYVIEVASGELPVARASAVDQPGAGHSPLATRHESRRLSYGELTADAARQAVPASPKLKSEFTLVGKRTKRMDGDDIITGRATYGLDVRLPGMLYASIERPPVIGGSVKSFDGSKAKKVPGVLDVVQVSRGVAVIGRDSWSVLKGREALVVEFDDGGYGDWDSRDYIASLKEAASKEGISTRREGDPAAALAAAAKTIEADYAYPFYAHAPVEPMNTTAWIHDGMCEIWSPTQCAGDVQEHCAKLAGVPAEVHVTLIGGGFGRRLGWDYALDATEVAKKTAKPVQLFWTRADDMRHGFFQAPSVHRMRAGLDAAGKPVLWSHRKVSTYHNARRAVTPQQMQDPAYNRGTSWGVYDVPYTIPAIDTSYVYVPTHIPIGPWRAVFAPSSVFARESFLDEVAAAVSRDPLQFRLDLLQGDEFTAGDLTISRARLRRVLETVQEKGKWGEKLPKGRGRGVACNVYDGVTHVAYVVDVRVDEKVHVEKVVCAIDCGLVVNPNGIEQQVEGGVVWGLSSALKGAITIRKGRVEQSSFGDFEVLRLGETPPIETHIVASDRNVPFGVGEPTVAPIVPALVNAVFAATNKRVRTLPIAL